MQRVIQERGSACVAGPDASANWPVQPNSPTKTKSRQSWKIREIGGALTSSGFISLDEQAKALGLGRSTTWAILRGNHKASGLSATTINRILSAPQLPPLVRARVLEYVTEKSAALYGHSKTQVRKFCNLLSLVDSADENTEPPGRPRCQQQSMNKRLVIS
jgi:hypothetical protein